MPSHRPMTAAWAGQRHATRMGPWGGVLPLCVQTSGRLLLGVCATALGTASEQSSPASSLFSLNWIAGFTSNDMPIGASSCTVAICGLP